MKSIFLILLAILFTSYVYRQDETIDGNLNLGNDAGLEAGQGKILYFYGVQSNSDVISMFRYNRAHNASDLRVNIGDDAGSLGDRFIVGVTDWRDNQYKPYFLVHGDGKVTIGTEILRDEMLAVNGKIRAKEIRVELAGWPDYVFAKGYPLPSLKETELYIREKGHLPGIPSAKQVEKNGLELGEMNKQLLQQIEELTLHLIEKDKQIMDINKLNGSYEERLKKLEALIVDHLILK